MKFNLLPVTGDELIGRDDEIKEIVSTLSNKNLHIGFALYGKRRIGKTSIFLEVERRLKKIKGIVPVYFSLWDLPEGTVSDFAKRFTASILDSYKQILGFKHKIKNLIDAPITILKDLISEFKISIPIQERIEFIFIFDKEKKFDIGNVINNVFELPERLAKETKTKCILLVDEFPSIINLKEGKRIGEVIIKQIRTIYEKQKNVIINISGSVRKTMELVALSSGSAFYRQFIIKEIKGLKKQDIKLLLQRGIPQLQIKDDALEKLYEEINGMPFYAQFIGLILLREGIKIIDKNKIENIIALFLNQEGNIIFKEEFERLSVNERKIVLSMAKGGLNTPSDIAKDINYQQVYVRQFLTYLQEKMVIEKVSEGNYQFSDKMFAKWLKLR